MTLPILTTLYYECGVCGRWFRNETVTGPVTIPPSEPPRQVNACPEHPGQSFLIQTLTRIEPEKEAPR